MEFDNFLIEKVSEKLATNKYPATLPGQRKLICTGKEVPASIGWNFLVWFIYGFLCSIIGNFGNKK